MWVCVVSSSQVLLKYWIKVGKEEISLVPTPMGKQHLFLLDMVLVVDRLYLILELALCFIHSWVTLAVICQFYWFFSNNQVWVSVTLVFVFSSVCSVACSGLVFFLIGLLIRKIKWSIWEILYVLISKLKPLTFSWCLCYTLISFKTVQSIFMHGWLIRCGFILKKKR